MDRETIGAALGGGRGVEHLLEGWEASQSSLPPDGELFFLAPAFVRALGEEAALDSSLAGALMAAAEQIAAAPASRALAWHAHHRLKERPHWGPDGPGGWPLPTVLAGDSAPLLYLLALLGELPGMRAQHEARSVPQPIYAATLHDIQRWADHYRRANGTWGMDPRHLPWYWLHLHGEVFEIGRLQYQPDTWDLPARAYRHAATRAVVALSEEGVVYRADGQRASAGGVVDVEGTWTATLREGPEGITGHRILPAGRVEAVTTSLRHEEWAEVLRPGDPVLSLHIPQGTPLDLEACRRSLEDADSFFARHFPDRQFRAFSCESWLLDPQLEEKLPPTSNLVRFLRQMYLIPVQGDGGGAFFFVFDTWPVDLHSAPRDTTLRRVVIDHVLGGGHWRSGGCFFLAEDLPAWGSDVYRVGIHRQAPGESPAPTMPGTRPPG